MFIFAYRAKLNIFATELQNVINLFTFFMNRLKSTYLIILSILFLVACGNAGPVQNVNVLITTSLGDIKIRLYDETPVHRDNFIKLVNSKAYEGVLFHRVIKDFMIQTGDVTTRQEKPLSDTLENYTIPAEFRPELFHKKGAVAAARMGNEVNPEMRSSGMQFYIVQGVQITDDELNNTELRLNNNAKQGIFIKLLREIADSNRIYSLDLTDEQIQERASLRMYDILEKTPDHKFTEEQRNAYKTIGGVPRLDGTYTVFGEVLEGLDIVDQIAAVETDMTDKPLNDIRILKMKIVK